VLRKEEHARRLGSRLGQVIQTDMSYPNYVRVRVLFPLANALLASTKVRICGRCDMEVLIHHENVPFFYFICGRIGHSDKECLEDEVGTSDVRFGVELRASPPKRLREVKVQSRSATTRFLNFEGAHRSKLQDQASWSGNTRGRANPTHKTGMSGEEEEVGNSIPKEEEHELMHGVTQMDVKEANTSSTLPLVYGPNGVQ
jgi:hypothetical protein